MATTLYSLLEEVASAFGSAFGVLRQQNTGGSATPPLLLQFRAGYAESPGWILVQAEEFVPEPLTVDTFRHRDVYGAPRIVRALFDVMVTEQWLDEKNTGEYTLTDTGRDILARSQARRGVLLTQLSAYLSGDLAYLATLLNRVITASLQGTMLPDTWCVAHSRHRAPTVEAFPLWQLFQYGDDFNALRDDAHMAAWQPLHIDGAAWEAFAYVCDGQATSAADLVTHLAHRGYTQQEYAAFLGTITARGWLQEQEGRYVLTETGQQVRAQVEQQTDVYFAAPWGVLSPTEFSEVERLLIQLRDELLGMALKSES